MLKHELRQLTMLLIMVLVAATAHAQGIKVSGTIVDEQSGEPLTGVTVMQKGTNNGVISDLDGKYAITVPTKSTLTFSYMGFSKKEVAVGGRTHIDIALSPDSRQLDELVVIGYGVQRRAT